MNNNGAGGDCATADYAVGTSKTPEGPFTYGGGFTVGRAGGGDFDIFVDDADDAAYLIYTGVHSGHTMAVERLTDDYLRSAAEPAAFADDVAAATGSSTVVGAGSPSSSSSSASSASSPYAASSTSSVSPRSSNVSSGVFGNVFVEAPAMFKRKNTYYALFGNCCCFCGHGSGIGVYTAPHPLGPWMYHNNVGCLANTTLTDGCGCGMNHALGAGSAALTGLASSAGSKAGFLGERYDAAGKLASTSRTSSSSSENSSSTVTGKEAAGSCSFYGKSLTTAQQNFVIRIPQADGSTQLVWTGDRWQSAADGVKAHDLQYWSVLRFTEGDSEVGGVDLPMQFAWEDEITITV